MRLALLLLLCLVAPASNAESLMDRISSLTVSKQPDFLKPDDAFRLEVKPRDAHTLQASFSVTPTYYLYRDKVVFTSKDSNVKIVSVTLPKGEIKHDPNFGDTEVFHHSFQGLIALSRTTNAATSFTLDAVYQGCSEEGLCYPPITKSLRISLPKVAAEQTAAQTAAPLLTESAQPPSQPVSEDSKIAKLFKDGNFWLIVSFFFGAGLLLSLTPCVFPMIPILSGIIVGRGHKITHRHAFLLSLAYVLGMAITYAAAGVAAGYSGNLISNALQTPWVLGSFAALFVLLSLSMFGFYEFQLPTALQSRLSDTSNRLHGGHISGVFAMGALSAIIMGPCVAAPLAGALLYIGQTHDAVLGGVALFVMSLGMGVPLLLIGVFGRRVAAQSRCVDGIGQAILRRDVAGSGDLDHSAAAARQRGDAAVGGVADLFGDLSACTGCASAQCRRLAQAAQGCRPVCAVAGGSLPDWCAIRREGYPAPARQRRPCRNTGAGFAAIFPGQGQRRP